LPDRLESITQDDWNDRRTERELAVLLQQLRSDSGNCSCPESKRPERRRQMANKVLIKWVVLVSTSLVLAGCGRKMTSSIDGFRPDPTTTSSLSGEQWNDVADELGQYFQIARQAFLKMDFKTATLAVRQGARFVREELGDVSSRDMAELSSAVKELDVLADDLDQNRVTSLDQMDAVLTRSHQTVLERGGIVVDEDRRLLFQGEPEPHFRLAQQSLQNNDLSAAAAEIRTAVELMKLEARYLTPAGQKDSIAQWEALNELAVELEKRSVIEPHRPSTAFAAAHTALAKAHELRASQSWAAHEYTTTAYELQAAAIHLERGAAWVDHGAEESCAQDARSVQVLTRRLMDGDEAISAAVNKSIESIELKIGELTQEITLVAKS